MTNKTTTPNPLLVVGLDRKVIRHIPDRDIAIALVLELAESGLHHFALLGFYDDDAEFLDGLAHRLGVEFSNQFVTKVKRVVRKLVQYGVLYGQMRGTHKEYIGEPTKQMEYGFAKPGKAGLLTRGETSCTGTPEWEAGFLLRYAYPRPDDDV